MRESSRRRAMASAVYQPCFNAFLFPLGAPGDGPTAIRSGLRIRRRARKPAWAVLLVRRSAKGLRASHQKPDAIIFTLHARNTTNVASADAIRTFSMDANFIQSSALSRERRKEGPSLCSSHMPVLINSESYPHPLCAVICRKLPAALECGMERHDLRCTTAIDFWHP